MIAKETGWTVQYINWGISWVNLQMMLADAPGLSKKKKKKVQGKDLAARFKARRG